EQAIQTHVRRVADRLEDIGGFHQTASCGCDVGDGRSKFRAWRSSGNHLAQRKVTAIAPIPPATTEATGPIRAARNPLSASPSSFEAEMKSDETEPTRPRMSSGVESWISDWRTYTENMSAAPRNARQTSDSGIHRDRPKTMVDVPNTPTAANILTPTLCF